MEADPFSVRDVVRILAALAHDKRYAIFRLLAAAKAEGLVGNEIAASVGIPITTASTNLGIMCRAGVVCAQRENLKVFYRLNSPRMQAFWTFFGGQF